MYYNFNLLNLRNKCIAVVSAPQLSLSAPRLAEEGCRILSKGYHSKSKKFSMIRKMTSNNSKKIVQRRQKFTVISTKFNA